MNARTKQQLWNTGAVALFIGLPLLLVLLSVSNMLDASEADDQAARKRATASNIIAQLEKHRARAMPVDVATLYLSSVSDSLARAELQERATKLVAQAGGRLAEVQLVGTPEQEADGLVALQLSLDIDNKGLLDLLYTIESGLPLLDVTSLSAQKGNGQGDSKGRDDGTLHVEMNVQAHWRRRT